MRVKLRRSLLKVTTFEGDYSVKTEKPVQKLNSRGGHLDTVYFAENIAAK